MGRHGVREPAPDAAPTVSTAMAGLDTGLDPFLSGPLRQVAKVEYEAACNWKLLVENHIDVYHLWYLHMRSLAAYDHRSFAWESLGDNWWSLEPLKDLSTEPVGLRVDPRGHAARIGAYLFFPNLMLVTTDDYFATYDATPIDARPHPAHPAGPGHRARRSRGAGGIHQILHGRGRRGV